MQGQNIQKAIKKETGDRAELTNVGMIWKYYKKCVLKLHKNFLKNVGFRVIYLKFTFAIDK